MTRACALNVPCAEVAALATFTGLSPQQSYGEVCVGTCGRSFLQHPYPDPVRAGIAEHGGIVFACPDCAARPIEDGGLGIRPDEDESWAEGQFRFTPCACAPTGPPHQDGCGWAASRPEQGGRA